MRVRRIAASVGAAVIVAGGVLLGAAPAASAESLGSFTVDCGVSSSVGTVSGQIGDTFTIQPGEFLCNLGSTSAGVVSWVTDDPQQSGTDPAAVSGTGNDRGQFTVTVTLIAEGTTTFTALQGPGGTFSITVTAPEPAPTPTADAPPIPAWVQAYGIFHQDDACEAGWTNSWQKWAEPVTGGWVCTRSIPSLG